MSRFWREKALGNGLKITEFSALGVIKLPHIWQKYNEAFAELPIGLPAPDEPETVHARHLYTLMIDKERCGIGRDEFMQKLHQMNIGTGVHYIGLHLHPYYRDRFGYKPEDYPNATWISDRTVSIPLSPKLTEADVAYITKSVRNVLC